MIEAAEESSSSSRDTGWLTHKWKVKGDLVPKGDLRTGIRHRQLVQQATHTVHFTELNETGQSELFCLRTHSSKISTWEEFLLLSVVVENLAASIAVSCVRHMPLHIASEVRPCRLSPGCVVFDSGTLSECPCPDSCKDACDLIGANWNQARSFKNSKVKFDMCHQPPPSIQMSLCPPTAMPTSSSDDPSSAPKVSAFHFVPGALTVQHHEPTSTACLGRRRRLTRHSILAAPHRAHTPLIGRPNWRKPHLDHPEQGPMAEPQIQPAIDLHTSAYSRIATTLHFKKLSPAFGHAQNFNTPQPKSTHKAPHLLLPTSTDPLGAPPRSLPCW